MIMSESELKKEFERNNVEDNPFDVLLYQSLELTRGFLFAISRLKSGDVNERFCISEELINHRIDIIKKNYKALQSMTSNAVDVCRSTAYYQPIQMETNNLLLKLERCMETVYTRSVPCRNLEFERIRLGDGSMEFNWLCELRSFVDKISHDKRKKYFDILSSVEEYYRNPDKYEGGFEYFLEGQDLNSEEYDDLVDIIREYGFDKRDIDYMKSYLNTMSIGQNSLQHREE